MNCRLGNYLISQIDTEPQMKKSIFLLLLIISTKLFAQNAVIEGVTFDKAAAAPLEFASVSLFKYADSVLVNGQMADAS